MGDLPWTERLVAWVIFLPIWLAYRLVWLAAKTGHPDARAVYSAMWDANLDLPPLLPTTAVDEGEA